MTTITNLTHDVIGYLVTQCQQSAVLGSAPPPFTVAVIDGPTGSGELAQTAQRRLWIGWDSLTGAPDAGTATQRWPFLGASGNYREETGSIQCTADAWGGDLNPADTRAITKSIVGAVEIMLRGAPTTGPGDSTMGGLVQWSQVEEFTWTQDQDATGYGAACAFKVTYLARLPP